MHQDNWLSNARWNGNFSSGIPFIFYFQIDLAWNSLVSLYNPVPLNSFSVEAKRIQEKAT